MGRLTAFALEQTGDRVLQKVQQNIAATVTPLLGAEIIDGVLVGGITVVSGTPKTVNHGLGRLPRGYIECGKDAAAHVYETTSARSDRTLTLNASATVNLSIWVF